MMDRELAEKKIEALLHDPPGKAPTLWYRSHERFSAELVEMALGRAPRYGELTKAADREASAVDRTVFRDPVAYRTDFAGNPQIVHPLSGTRYELRPLTGQPWEKLEQEQARVVGELVAHAGGPGADPERLYYHLWRGLEPALAGAGRMGHLWSYLPADDVRMGHLWSYLPADTRIPDHSIWDHMRLTSAMAGAWPEPALLLFSFGPVQSLIEAARSTGDLWAGSFLLSWLAWRAMRGLVAEWGGDAVLFPHLNGQPLVDEWLRREREWPTIHALRKPGPVASLPNRFLALVPAAEAERLAKDCVTAVREALDQFARDGVAALGGVRATAQSWPERAAQQARRALACYWQAVPWDVARSREDLQRLSETVLGASMQGFWETRKILDAGAQLYQPLGGSYFAVHSQLAEAGLAAVKATRLFDQIDEVSRRCTVCGLREALWREETDRPISGRVRIAPGERLCGLCLARRAAPRTEWAEELAGDKVVFPSTHTLAVDRFHRDVIGCLRRVGHGTGNDADAAVEKAVRAFLTAADGTEARTYATRALMRRARACRELAGLAVAFIKLSAELLDAATFEPHRRDDGTWEDLGLDEASAARLSDARSALLRATDQRGIARPGAYYAVLVMDGDHMGKWLAGVYAPKLGEVIHELARPRDNQGLLDTPRPVSVAHKVAVSHALNQFSLDIVGPVIEDVHGGVVVYAGGDDALAMLPLDAVFPCVRDLRRLYAGLPLAEGSAVGGDDFGYESDQGYVRKGRDLWRVMGQRATVSAGVAIAHQKWPLRRTLATAREMERRAKRDLGRNAVAVAVLKRSGGHEHFGVCWGEGTTIRKPDPFAVLEEVAELIQSDRVSRRFAYALREEAEGLWQLKHALAERAYWLIKRHWRKGVTFEAERAQRVAGELQALAEWLDATSADQGAATVWPAAQRFRAGLGLAEFIARNGGGTE